MSLTSTGQAEGKSVSCEKINKIYGDACGGQVLDCHRRTSGALLKWIGF